MGQAAWTRLITATDQETTGETGPDGKLLASAAVRRRGGETKACSGLEGGTQLGCGRTHTAKRKGRMATTGIRTPSAKEPEEDQAGVSATVGGSLPADG